MSTTGAAIRLAVARTLGGEDGRFREAENTAATAGAITDAINLAGTGRYTPQAFQAWRVRNAADGALSYGTTLVPSTGVLSLNPSVTPASGDDIELWHPDLPHPDEVDKARDRALANRCTRWRLVPLAWAQDADFIASGVANWTGSSATPTKVAKSGLERFSEFTLRVLNSGANGYAGQTINNPGGAGSGGEAQEWFLYVLAQADVGTAQITVQDLTNGAALTLTGEKRISWSGEAFQAIRLAFSALLTTEQISLRLGGSGASDDTYWANLCVYPQDATEFVLPSRVVNGSFVGQFYELVGDDWPEERLVPLARQPEIVDAGGGFVRVLLRDGAVGQRAIFWGEYAHYSALQTVYTTKAGRTAGDTATTDCPLDYARWATLYELFPARYEKQYRAAHASYGAKRTVRLTREYRDVVIA